jgi:hypothetical protein
MVRMPISNTERRKEQDRQRSEKRRRRLRAPAKDTGKFARWLDHVLEEEGLRVSDLADGLGKDALDYGSYLRRVRKGGRVPKPERTYRIGEALRVCGVLWCSGPVALFESNHHVELVDFVSALATISARKAASFIAALADLSATRRSLTPLPDERQQIIKFIREPRMSGDVECAREKLTKCYDVAFDDAWSRATTIVSRSEAATELKTARMLAFANDLTAEQREERVIDAFITWLERSDRLLIEDNLFRRRVMSRVYAEIALLGIDRATMSAQIATEMCKSTHSTDGPLGRTFDHLRSGGS